MRIPRWLILALAGAVLAAAPLTAQKFESVPEAQQQAPAPAAAQMRIGIINAQLAMARTQEGRKAGEELEAKFNPRRNELQKLQEEVKALEEKLSAQERTLSDDARQQLLRDLEQKRKTGSRLQEDFQEEFQDAQSAVIQQIGAKLQQVIDRYARENNLNVIFNVAPGGPIIYATPTVDITDAIVRLYDQTHPVETAKNPAGSSTQPPQPQ